MTDSTSFPTVRRIVTGHTDGHEAIVISDGPAENARNADPMVRSTLIWSTDCTPAVIPVGSDVEDMGARVLGMPPPPNGSRFTVMDVAPGNRVFMHRTETIDYVIVIEGSVDMDLDGQTVSLHAGDVLVQRGTNHAWVNRSDERARIAFVLVDAQPLGIGNPIPRPTA